MEILARKRGLDRISALTGNLEEGGLGLALFIDALPGGQSTLQTQGMPEPPSGISELTGLTFDELFHDSAKSGAEKPAGR